LSSDVILRQDDTWLHFTNPRHVITTEKTVEVRKSLSGVENLVNEKGWHAAGFLSYESAPAFDASLRVVPSPGFPLLWFGLYEAPQVIKDLEEYKESSPLPNLRWQPDVEKESYNAAIQTIKDRIAQGQTYQVNYTMRLKMDFEADPWTLFLHLARSQNKYAAFIDIGAWAICSASHELFFDLDGEIITGRPMKGTVRRGRTSAEDKANSNWLHASTKNRAENVMIVDMIRNDIGRIAQIGSVHVPGLFTVEKYPTLFQMTSTVQAKTSASVTEIFTALFPCASITGAPKVSTMKIIADLENGPRKIYTGSIGTIAPDRKARFNVAIRTALVDKENKAAEYGVGGGIVWDSTSTDEYSEALLKARILTDPPQEDFSLFETLLWTPQEGYFLPERHIARLSDSSEYFGFPKQEEAIREILAETVAEATSPKRVKIWVDRQGNISAETKDVQPLNKIFRVCLAKEPVHSGNRFLFHKTTQREIYEKSMIRGFDDVLLFNERNELTEFTIGNLVAEMNGHLYTPPIECGLLAGTFRAELLEGGVINERVITLNEIPNCTTIFLINSVRRWVKTSLVPNKA